MPCQPECELGRPLYPSFSFLTPIWGGAGLPAATPLKAALTGLELLLLRAQLWQETAARHVSLERELAPIAALAKRWRRLELASWRRLLRRTAERSAAGLCCAFS